MIRRATVADTVEVTSILQEAIADAWSQNAIADSLSDPTIYVFVHTEDTAVCGVSMLRVAADEGEILNIATVPTQRRRGIGTALLHHTLQTAAKLGAATVYIEVRKQNLPACALYEKNGFRSVGIRKNYYKNPPDDAILMCLRMAEATADN